MEVTTEVGANVEAETPGLDELGIQAGKATVPQRVAVIHDVRARQAEILAEERRIRLVAIRCLAYRHDNPPGCLMPSPYHGSDSPE